jgi:Putative DNA-binding domain
VDLNLSVLRSPLADVDDDFLLRLVREGETRAVERKEQPSGLVLGEASSSFANTLGGWVLIGVEDRVVAGKAADGSPPDIRGWEPPGQVDLQDWVREILRNQVDPIPPFAARMAQLNGKPVGVVRVYESTVTPHVVRKTGAIYVRGQGGKEPATHADVARLAARSSLAEAEAQERFDLVGDLDVASAELPLLPSGAAMHVKTIRLRVAPLTLRPGFHDDALTEAFVDKFGEEVLPVICGGVPPSPERRLSQHGFRFHVAGYDGLMDESIARVGGVDGRGVINLATLRGTIPEDARRVALDAQRNHFASLFAGAGVTLRALEALGNAVYRLDFQTPSQAYVEMPHGAPGGSLPQHGRLQFSGHLVVPCADAELRGEAERCARQLARAAGIAVYEPLDARFD